MIFGDVEIRSIEFLSRYVLALAGSVAETELCRCQGGGGLMSCRRRRSFVPLAFGECWVEIRSRFGVEDCLVPGQKARLLRYW